MADKKEEFTSEAKASYKKIQHAREMYSAVIAHQGGTPNPLMLATHCFHYADHFAVAEAMFLAGTLHPEEDFEFYDEAFCPNVSKTAPVNMMSRKWGDLETVKEVLRDLKELDRTNWSNDQKAEVIVYEKLHWNRMDVAQAEHLFPQFLEKADRLMKRKAERDAKYDAAKAQAAAASN